MEKDENRIIEYKKIQEKYPAIARLAIAVKPPNQAITVITAGSWLNKKNALPTR